MTRLVRYSRGAHERVGHNEGPDTGPSVRCGRAAPPVSDVDDQHMRVLYVALGGAIGSTARYLLDGAVYRIVPPTFPYGTFIVNVLGCLFFGLLIGAAEERL